MASERGRVSARGYSLSNRQINLFPSGTKFINESGHFFQQYKPMAMVPGKEYSSFRLTEKVEKDVLSGKTILSSKKTSRPWKSKRGGTGGQTMSVVEFSNHLMIAAYEAQRNAENFAVVLSLRAQKIFQNSFRYKKFYSADGSAWPALTPNTIRRRTKLGTWPGAGGMLQEFGDLYRSIKQRNLKGQGGQVYTDPNEFKHAEYKNGKRRRTFCYAGIHNNGAEMGLTYGNGFGGKVMPVGVKNRQFIGHSTYLFQFARSIMRQYLFDEVFLTAKKRR